jgi:hypothetical protein
MRPLTICSLCDLSVDASRLPAHVDSARCSARQRAFVLRERGLLPVGKPVLAQAKSIREALALFGIDSQIHDTREISPLSTRLSKGAQVWTSEHGVLMANVFEHVAKILGIGYPEAARRLHEHPELIASFETARRLDAEAVTLRALLSVIDYVIGSDGKRRPHDGAWRILGRGVTCV